MKTWLITGIGRGLGLAIARAALQAGDRVVGTLRAGAPDLTAPAGRLHPIACDLSDPEQLDPMLQRAFAVHGRLDVIVNNAGFGLIGAVDAPGDAELRRLFEVDMFAPLRILRLALPRLRAQGGGHVINITSIAGRAPGPGAALYAAAKSAVEGFSVAVAQELAQDNIRVTAIAPGQFRTGFLDAAGTRPPPVGQDQPQIRAALDQLRRLSGHQIGDPDRAARAIVRVAHAPHPPLQLLLGTDALQRQTRRLREMRHEMRQWRDLTRSTDFGAPGSDDTA